MSDIEGQVDDQAAADAAMPTAEPEAPAGTDLGVEAPGAAPDDPEAVTAEAPEAPEADTAAAAPEAEVAPSADEAPAPGQASAADETVAAPPDADAAEAPAASEFDDAPAADDGDEAAEPGGDEAHEAAEADAAEPAAPATPTTVAELVAATLRAAGVRLAFTVPGESFLPVLDALHAAGIRIVATRHEGAAAMAAEAYGQLTGRPAVALGTRAVGAANLAIGVHTATADSAPLFVLVGDIDRASRGREAFQEIDLVGTVGKLAKWAGRIEDAETAAATLEGAAHAVLEGRPGPAFLALPEDVLDLPLPEGTRAPVVRPHPEAPSVGDVRAVLHALAGAERPLILAGAGVLRARCSNDLVRLAELLHVPVVSSWRRGDVIPNDHPLYLGMTGFGSPAVVRERVAAADVLVVIGSRLSEPTTAAYTLPAPGQRWIHIDVEPRTGALGETPAPVLSVRADARAFLRAAVAKLKDAVLLAEPLQARDRHNAADRAAYEAATVVDHHPWSGPGVNPGKAIADLRRLLPEDAIVTTDAGAFGGWAARGFRFKRPGTFLGPTSGAMGYAFPAALAAAVVHRERRVVALVGDGGMGMTLAELETAVREGAHVVAVVFDNERYGMIRDHQERRGSPASPGTDLGPLDFAAAARACGARGVRVDSDAAFEPALRTALAASGLSLIHVLVDRRWVSVDQPAIEA
ncbi:MAG: thiamine pyrophosphate-binding protein [Chloroflexota bacterium]